MPLPDSLATTVVAPSAGFGGPDSAGASGRHGLWLAGIMIAAVAVRVASALYQGDAVSAMPGVYDQISYDALARRVHAGYGFSFGEDWWPATPANEPTAHWSFLYTLFIAFVYKLAGLHPLAVRLAQAILAGILQPWLTWRLGVRLFGMRTGLIAAAVSAQYAYFVYYSGAMVTETFYCIAVLSALDLTTRILVSHRPSRIGRWLLLGLAIGVAVLLRQTFLLFVPILLSFLVWRIRQRGRAAGEWKPAICGVTACLAVLGAMIVPWTVRNQTAFGRFVLLNTNAGFVFFWANHPIHGTNFIPILPDSGESYRKLIPTEFLELNEAEMERKLFVRGLELVAADPGRYLLLSLSRTAEYFKFWPTAESGATSNIARVFSFGLMLPFLVYGLWLFVRRQAKAGWRDNSCPATPHQGRVAGRLLLIVFIIVYTLIHLLTWSLIRYRLPVDAVFVIFAAIGISSLARKFQSALAQPKGLSAA